MYLRNLIEAYNFMINFNKLSKGRDKNRSKQGKEERGKENSNLLKNRRRKLSLPKIFDQTFPIINYYNYGKEGHCVE